MASDYTFFKAFLKMNIHKFRKQLRSFKFQTMRWGAHILKLTNVLQSHSRVPYTQVIVHRTVQHTLVMKISPPILSIRNLFCSNCNNKHIKKKYISLKRSAANKEIFFQNNLIFSLTTLTMSNIKVSGSLIPHIKNWEIFWRNLKIKFYNWNNTKTRQVILTKC